MFTCRTAQSIRRLQWKLTLSYTAVTVGSLLAVGLIVRTIFFENPDSGLTAHSRDLDRGSEYVYSADLAKYTF